MSELLHKDDDLSGFAHETDLARPPARPNDCQAEQNVDVSAPKPRTIRVVRNGQYLGTLLG
jgi:hypothetical protein